MLELLYWGVSWEELIPQEEDKVNEATELDCSALVGALGFFERSEALVESQGEQVSNLVGFVIGGEGCGGDDGVANTELDSLFSLDRRVLQDIFFKLPGETSVHSSVGLGVWRLSWVVEAIQ